jgi:hypothetical protein
LIYAQPNGRFASEGFLKWLKEFLRRVSSIVTDTVTVMLSDDGHGNHKNSDVILFARSHQVQMLSLPPHIFHKLKPPDRALMKAFNMNLTKPVLTGRVNIYI